MGIGEQFEFEKIGRVEQEPQIVPCVLYGCKHPAISHVQWGTDSNQQGNLCSVHIQEVWRDVQGLITMGNCFWTQGPPRTQEHNGR